MKSITRYISLTALFLIPIFPLIVANNFFFPFITGKAFYFRILVEIAFASWMILAFLDAKYRPRLNSLTIGVTVFALVTLAADLLGVNPIRSIWSNFERMEGWITVVHLWMFFIATTSLFGNSSAGSEESKRMWRRYLNFELAIAFIVACYGLFQLFGWAAIHQGSTRIDASLGNAAYMAVYMLINSGLAVYLFVITRMKSKYGEVIFGSTFLQWIYGILAVLFAFEVFETSTRGTILGLFGGIMLALFLYMVLGKDGSKSLTMNVPRKSKWISAGIIGFMILLGLVLWLNRSSSFVQSHEVLNRLANISWSESQGQARNYIWPMAITGWSQKPILGWGQENFNYIFNANYNPKMWSQEQWFDRAHSVYLDWLTASGIVGLLAYLALYVLLLRAIWKNDFSLIEKCVLTGLVAGYAIHNIFVFDNLASYVLFFMLLGFSTSFKANDGQDEVRIIGGEREFSSEMVEYIVAPICIVVLIAGIYFLNVRVIQANINLIGALQSCGGPTPDVQSFEKVFALNVYTANQEAREQLLSCASSIIGNQQTPGPTKQAFFQESMKALQDQIAATPKDARIYVLAGSFLNNLQQFELARPILEKAHALTPEKQTVDFELATNYLNTGSTTEAVALLKKAYEGDPTYAQARTSYGIGLMIIGKEAEARQMFNNDPAIFETAQAASLFASLKEYDKAIAVYQKLIVATPSDYNLKLGLARVQFTAGMKSQAIETMRTIEKTNPELKEQVEAAIKTI